MTEYFDSIAKRIANILLTLAVSFALFACADIGERDNPVDPGYKGARVEELSSSSSWSLDVSSSSSWSLEEAIGSMTDSRDGHTYKTVTIGTQTWMAENLNYNTSGSYCYGDNAGNCSKYGRLYEWSEWSAAMDACPTGWHLPNDEEWNTLWDAVGGTNTAGSKLKSTSGWYDNGNGTDSFGFAVLPAGYRDYYGTFRNEGYSAHFWSSSEDGSIYAYGWYFSYYFDYVYCDWYYKHLAFSVRCLRDSDEGSGASSSSSQAQPSSFSSSSSSRSLEEAIGSMTDSRDGQVYKTVTIGTQTWMAENLNYNTSGSYCYGDNAGNCSKYGRLYEWSAAMDACPTGWHLPSDEEWNTLWDAVGGTNTAGSKLKSTSGWYDNDNGTDSFGFAVLPAGRRYDYGNFYGEGDYAGFWSSTEYDSSNADRWYFRYSGDDVHYGWGSKYYAFSVRCLRD